MSTHDKDHDRSESLRQELLEYYFDCHPDAEAMAERLEADPKLAALYEEVQRTASLLQDAALEEAPPLKLTTPGEADLPAVPGVTGVTELRAAPDLPPVRSGFTFKKAWLSAAAGVAIALLPAIGIYVHRTYKVSELENGKVAVLLSAPPAVPDGTPLRFHVETKNLAQRPMVAQVDWKILDESGAVLTESTTVCDGSVDITASGSLNKPRKLVVTARVPETGFTKTIEQEIHPTKSAPLVHVTSDKPAYRPGESVRIRIACLDRLTLRGANRVGLRCRVVDPKDAQLQTRVLGVGKGVTAWTYRVQPSAIGGTYALEVQDQKGEITLERHEFLVRNFQPPKLKKKIVLDRQTYAAGETGSADLHVLRAGGGAAAGAKVVATLIVDGDEKWKDQGVLDAEGRAVFTFQVPGNVLRGAARFVTKVTDGGNVETQLEPFVIPTDKVEVALYPEGGDLVAGAENRVYAQVRDALGRPLSGTGDVVDDKGNVVTKFQTLHMGRTRFAFTPELGRKYTLKLTSPFAKSFDLPTVHDVGVVVQPDGECFAEGEPAKLKVFTRGRGPWIASVFCRGVLVGQQSILRRGASAVQIPLVEEASGVLRVTIFDHKMRPVAERLVQRPSKRGLVVTVTPDAKRLSPGGKQKIKIQTADETGEPVSCVVGVTVTDRSVADMLDFIRTGIADQHQLWTDVEKPDDKLEEFLSRTKDFRRNIDLLLGSLGWRRYVWRGDADEKALIAAGGDWAKALPVREGRSYAPMVTDTLAAHQAELRVVHHSKRKAHQLLGTFGIWAGLAFGLLGVTHLLVLLARRMQWRPPVVVSSAWATLAIVLLALVNMNQRLGEAVGLDSVMLMDAAPASVAREATSAEFFDDGDARWGVGGDAGGNLFTTRLGFADERTVVSNGYVRNFDVQIARGATIAEDLTELEELEDETIEFGFAVDEWNTAVGLGGRGRFARTTGSESFYLDGVRSQREYGWVWNAGGPAGAGGGAYRGPGNLTPVPNPQQSAQQILTALVERERAQRELRDLPADLPGRPARIALLKQTIQKQDVMLDLVNRRYPAIFETLHPVVTGTVSRVGAAGRLVTIALQSGAPNLMAGMRFAIFNGTDGYKGEATVSEVDASRLFCFARLSLRMADVTVGDSASTNLTDTQPLWTTPAARRRVETILGNPGLARTVFRYQHQASDTRGNFAETLFWQPYLVTDEKGEATIEFDVNDSITTWSIFADAHGNGRVGQGEGAFDSFLPFSLDPKVPTRVAEGDVLQIPVAIVADDASTKEATIEVTTSGAVTLKARGERRVPLRDGRGRWLAEIAVQAPDSRDGFRGSISIRGKVAGAKDVVGRRFVIVPRGFPRSVEHAGKVRDVVKKTLRVPDELARRTAELKLRFYPSPLANLEGALQGMLREPSGCFEQVSSTNYPNVMVLSMLETSGDNVPAAAAKARRMLANGYKKLTGYEVDGGGFEWWGKKPAHAALTAYGLMQFADMAKVHEVDQAMLARTRTWLLGKRDGKGGFVTGGGRYGHFMGGSPESRSAYIAYALLYAGESAASMKKEVTWLEQRAKATDNTYELAVAACGLAAAGHPAAEDARKLLVRMQKKDGSLLGTGSITGSGPRDLHTETTAFAVLAWLSRDPKRGDTFDAPVHKAVQFLEKQRAGGGHFGGTQATVMALKALTAYLSSNTKAVQPGELKIFLNNEEVAKRPITGSEKRTIEIDHLERELGVGDNALRIELTGGNEFPFSVELTYRADQPDSSKRCAVDLRTYLTKKVIAEGGTTALHAVISNTTNVAVSSPMVLVGLPAGLHVDSKILDDLKKAETIAAWELSDRTIILYLRGLQAGEKRDIVIDLVGRIPGTTKGPASRAYLYYANREKKWVAPLEVVVTPGG